MDFSITYKNKPSPSIKNTGSDNNLGLVATKYTYIKIMYQYRTKSHYI